MKKILLLLVISSSLLFTSCQGDQGPPGQDGINILGQVFEVNINFQYDVPNNIYKRLVTIPTSIEVFESDVILVYRLEGLTAGGDDIWGQLPQNRFFGNGDIFQYVFDHTFYDVQLLIDGNFDLSLLSTDFTDSQIFRIAVIPAEFATTNLTMDELLQGLQINPTEIEKID
jgi:hypothetical protein